MFGRVENREKGKQWEERKATLCLVKGIAWKERKFKGVIISLWPTIFAPFGFHPILTEMRRRETTWVVYNMLPNMLILLLGT